MNDLISIIVPVYNVELYLKQCIKSIIKQTYDNIEIILVDDGSTDQSGKICDDYKIRNKKVIVLHKENGGLSDARNAGLNYASGKYVFFLDSDDWIKENTIESLYNTMIDSKSDIVISNYYYLYDNRSNIAINIDKNIEFNRIELMEALIENKFIKNFAWGKLYKKELLDNYKFPKGRLFEDVYWTHLIFAQVNKAIFVKEPLIYYRQRENSISFTFNKNRIDLLIGYLKRRYFIKNNFPQLLYKIDETIIDIILQLYIECIKKFNKNYTFEFIKELKARSQKFAKEINIDNKINKKKVKDFNIFMKSPFLYLIKYTMYKIKEKIC
ncbi:glycosyltransferase family 2 protein [Thomasclavelia sp.]